MTAINSLMTIREVAEHMGQGATSSEASRMRDLILNEAINYGWENISDIEEPEWFAMMEEATKPAHPDYI
jgi:hypothetical protein